MTEQFAFEPDVSRGQWIADRLDGSAGSEALSGAIPIGYEALVRVLHPFSRDRLVGDTYGEWIDRQATSPAAEPPESVLERDITWREVAHAHGTEFSPASLSHQLLGLGYGEHRDVESGDGWRYHSPEEGSLIAPVLGRVAAVLADHTSTPSSGVAAVWEGWGGLTSSAGVGFFFMMEPVEGLPKILQAPIHTLQRKRLEFLERKRRFGTGAALAALMNPRGRQPDGSGILSKEAAAGPRLELPARSYVCFQAGISDFVEAAESGQGTSVPWATRAPWVDPAIGWWVQSPNLIWPDGHEWVLLTEIDFDSTLVACSRECADALLAADGIDAVEITRDTPLWQMP